MVQYYGVCDNYNVSTTSVLSFPKYPRDPKTHKLSIHAICLQLQVASKMIRKMISSRLDF